MDENTRKAYEALGLVLDDEGYPLVESPPGPPRECVRCGALAECGGETAYASGDDRRHGAICTDCWRLSFTDRRAFWDGFKPREGNP